MKCKTDFFGKPLTFDDSLTKVYGKLHQFRKELEIQNNRGTAHPMYVVYEKVEMPPDTMLPYADFINKNNFINVFFTQKAANNFIEWNKHDYKGELFVYIKSGNNNPEWQLIREFIRGNEDDA